MRIELTEEEVKQIALMMEGAAVQLGNAEAGLALLKKFREAK